MQEMAGNPFVLSLMAIVARDRPGPLPERRTQLYRQVIEQLCAGQLQHPPDTAQPHHRAAGRALLGLRSDQIRHALGDVALALLKDHEGPTWPRQALERHFARSASVAKMAERPPDLPAAFAADTGLLVRVGEDRNGWRFLHRSLMECLAAEALARKGPAHIRRFAVRLRGGGLSRVWSWSRPEQVGRWAEVYCHLAAMQDNADSFLRSLRKAHPRLAVRAMLNLEHLPSEKVCRELGLAGGLSLGLVRALIERVEGPDALAPLLVRMAREHRDDVAGLQYVAAALVAIGADGEHMRDLCHRAGGAAAVGVSEPVWTRIPAGTFQMGSPDGVGYADERPQHDVTLRTRFDMLATPVTQALYAIVTGEAPSCFVGDLRRPVERVSWYGAVRFCEALGKIQSRRVALPTEAQWEYACRAHTDMDWSFGEGWRRLAATQVYGPNTHLEPPPVGSGAPNEFGLHDMRGNMWEWCRDWYGWYRSDPVIDPTGEAYGVCRVIRGGPHWNIADRARSAFYRERRDPTKPSHDLGFRVVRHVDRGPEAQANAGRQGGLTS